jgi:hypothetical protein
MKRKYACAALVLIVTGGAIFLLWPSDLISPDTYHKIQLGMTLADAEGVVGRSSTPIKAAVDDMIKRRARFVDPDPQSILNDGNDWSQGPPPDWTRIWCWEGSRGCIAIQLDEQGRVIGKRFEGPNIRLVDRLRFALGL